MQLRIVCPNEGCKHTMDYSDFYRGHESGYNSLNQYGYNQEGAYDLGSWPLKDSHFYVCDRKPIKCNKCNTSLPEKDMQRHRQTCRLDNEQPTTNTEDDITANAAKVTPQDPRAQLY